MTDKQKKDVQLHMSTLCKIMTDIADLRDYEDSIRFKEVYDPKSLHFVFMSNRYYKVLNEATQYLEMAISSLADAIS